MSERRVRAPWVERAVAATIVLVCAAAVLALMLHNRRMANEIASGIYIPKSTTLTSDALALQQYVRINTTNPPGNEIAGARWLGEQLTRAGVPFEIVESAPGRANLYARLRGTSDGDALLLLNHIDVVPASGAGWTRPPFSGSVVLNMLHGRGSIDMKGLAVCQLAAFVDVARSGRKPLHDIVFLATADEENGSEFGLRWLLAHRPDFFTGVRYVLTEGGVTEMERERVTYFGVEIGSKQIVDIDLVGRTREDLQRARIALEPYTYPRDVSRIEPGVRSYLRAVAANRREQRALFADVDKAAAEGKLWLLPPLNRGLLENSVWPFGIHPTTDGRFAMRVLLSNMYDENPDARLEWLLATVKPYGITPGTLHQKSGPAPLSPIDTPLWTIIERQVHHELRPAVVGPEVLPVSTTDSRFLRGRGYVCYGFQPFPTDFFQAMGIHGSDERIRLDWFQAGVRTMKAVVAEYAYGS